MLDPVTECFGTAALVEPFWKEVDRLFGYNSATPSLRDFAVSLFRGANPLDGQVTLHPHAKVFLQRWKDSQAHSVSFRQWSHQMESELQIATALGAMDDRKSLGDYERCASEVSAPDSTTVVKHRRNMRDLQNSRT